MMEVKSINETQDEIIEEFLDFDDWMDRYQLLIDLGSEQEPLADKYKTEQNLIDGCQSRVWLQADLVDGRIHFQAESDALIVKGIVTLLVRVLSDHTPREILDADLIGYAYRRYRSGRKAGYVGSAGGCNRHRFPLVMQADGGCHGVFGIRVERRPHPHGEPKPRKVAGVR